MRGIAPTCSALYLQEMGHWDENLYVAVCAVALLENSEEDIDRA
jgi:hypothetical protein